MDRVNSLLVSVIQNTLCHCLLVVLIVKLSESINRCIMMLLLQRMLLSQTMVLLVRHNSMMASFVTLMSPIRLDELVARILI